MKDIESTYNRLIGEMREETYTDTIERTATAIELPDGRRAWIIMRITTEDPAEESL